MTNLNELSAQEIGRRLRIARENVGIRQEEAAEYIGLSRPTLISIEKGTRRIRIEELQRLAKHYNTTVNGLLRREAIYVDLIPRFRKQASSNDEQMQEAVKLLNKFVRAEVEFENILGVKPNYNYPQERGINEGNVKELAEYHALELRNWLGLGEASIPDLLSLIEFDLGIRLYQHKLSSKSKIAGLYAYDQNIGACMLLNSNHPLPRRIQTAAHELGHFYCNRNNLEVQMQNETGRSREEQYAKAFGFAFTMPREKIAKNFRMLIEGTDTFTRRHVILLAHQFKVSREACVRRLEEIGEIPSGTWQMFLQKGGISDKQAFSVTGESPNDNETANLGSKFPVPVRLGLKAHMVWKRNLLSEGQLSELLELDRVMLRNLLYYFDSLE